jgi:D-alanyl-D-alanine dipeptidase
MFRALLPILMSLSCSFAAQAQTKNVDFDAKMHEYNLVDIKTLEGAEDIVVMLKYSTTDNFVGKDMYGDLESAYFTPDFAKKVIKAQQILQKYNPDYTLLIYDAARPISVQRHMRSLVEGTALQDFVADGTKGGRHNYGVAVDLTIATNDGTPLDMGTEFDNFTDAASVKGTPDTSDASTRTLSIYRDYVNSLAARGVISFEAAKNRILLLEVMLEAGLYPYRREWWHYEDIMSMESVRTKYKLLDF